MNEPQIRELLYQALETEVGGVQIYQTALRCALNDELKQEWDEYLEHTQQHVQIVRTMLEQIGLDPDAETPGRQVVRHLADSLVKAMEIALEAGDPSAAELVACECIVHAETKDHLNWELIGGLASTVRDDMARALQDAHEAIEDQEDEHLYHTMGWGRELWIQTLGMPAVLPPPEDQHDVKTAIGAARAKRGRARMKKAS